MESGWGIATLIETDDSGRAIDPQVAIDSAGNAIAVWSQSDGIRDSIWSNRYAVGAGWGSATLIEFDSHGAGNPEVGVDGSGNAIAVWYQHDGTYFNIFSNRYVVGMGWGTASLIETENLGDALYPQVAVADSGDAIAVWYQSDGIRDNIWSNRYEIGTGWGTAMLIESSDSGQAFYPQVAVDDSGNAIAVWSQNDGSRYNIYTNRYTAEVGWDTATLIEFNDLGDAYRPQIGIDASGNATAIWRQYDGAFYSIYSNRYVVGSGWGTPTLIETDNSGDAFDPQVSIDGSGNAVAVWCQYDEGSDSIYSNRYVIGSGWEIPTQIESSPQDTGSPQVGADGSGNAVAVWFQHDGTRYNIYSNRYAAGTGWGVTSLIETDNQGDAIHPQVAVADSGNAIAVWYQSGVIHPNIWSNRYAEPDTTPPPLSLVAPSEGLITETPVVTASGTTEAGVSLVINGISVAVESDGLFSCEIALVEGENIITATATDASGNSATVSVSVTYVSPVHELEKELEDTRDELVSVWDHLNETQDELSSLGIELETAQEDLSAAEEELSVVRDELNVTQDELGALGEEIESTQHDLNAAEEELSGTSDDLESVKSQNLALMMALAIVAILVAVMFVMYMSLRKTIADMGIKTADEETPPPQS